MNLDKIKTPPLAYLTKKVSIARWNIIATVVAIAVANIIFLVGCERSGIPSQPTSSIPNSNARTTELPMKNVPKATASPAHTPSLVPTATPQPKSTTEESIQEEMQEVCYQNPRTALNDFLSFLNTGEFTKAASLYGGEGDYPTHRVYPPNTKPEERIRIEAMSLADFCKGYRTCLKHKVVGEETISEDEIDFTVNFYEDDGKLLEFGIPAVDNKGNTYSKHMGPDFHLRVKKINGCYKCMDVPPITP